MCAPIIYANDEATFYLKFQTNFPSRAFALLSGSLIFRSHQFLRQRANVSLSQMVEVKNWADVGGQAKAQD
jgi:hypothetical protein